MKDYLKILKAIEQKKQKQDLVNAPSLFMIEIEPNGDIKTDLKAEPYTSYEEAENDILEHEEELGHPKPNIFQVGIVDNYAKIFGEVNNDR